MATLTKPRTITRSVSSPFLDSQIPAPFPREQLVGASGHHREEISNQEAGSDEEPSISVEYVSATQKVALKEVVPSIVHVQRSCLMTLNNLLSGSVGWQSIIPDRRHSMPPSAQGTSASVEESSSTSALQILVTNLRNREGDGEMIEAREWGTSDSDLLCELRRRVETISSSLSSNDASLAKALASLLSDLNRLSNFEANVSHMPMVSPDVETSSILNPPPPIDMFDTLTRQLSDLQVERLSSQASLLAPGSSPLIAVETALLWSRIDSELENVVGMCKERTEILPKFTHEHLPPQYDVADYDFENPPDYEIGGRASFDDGKAKAGHSHQINSDEKMRLDLESVAMAIDRLYLVAPQLHNQRVELKSTKLAQMEKARREGQEATTSQTQRSKGKERDVRELDNLLNLIGKASERTLKDQSVVLDGSMQTRFEKAQRRAIAKRDAFVEKLVRHSEVGRIHGQDALLPRTKDPQALLTLPEFMREPIPRSERLKDANALLTLPEFVREAVPPHLSQSDMEGELGRPTVRKPKKKRHRSLSAPPLAWLLSSSSRLSISSSSSSGSASKGKSKDSHNHAFDVIYVAENHENLHHTLVFVTMTGNTGGAEIQAEVLPPFLDHPLDGGDHLVIKAGSHSSLPLMLPAHVYPGLKEVRAQSGHYEVKLVNQAFSPINEENEVSTPLLDASQLTSINPTSFICASCSLPLVQSSKMRIYRDLPSEHWEELVEAWMCHGDQKLHDQVSSHGKRGFWPTVGQALVGGSYILFEESAVNSGNLHLTQDIQTGVGFLPTAAVDRDLTINMTGWFPRNPVSRIERTDVVGAALQLIQNVLDEDTSRLLFQTTPMLYHDDNWRLTRCLCGAIVGRCQDRPLDDASTTVYRILKYAVRPISLATEPLKIPLSAFIVEDMIEFVHAHASYRFVIQDEEEEKPRILIWLFKPKIRLAYSTPSSHAIPKSANIVAAKVLFKLLKPVEGPSDITSLLNKYPGFPQAEYLSYPMSICRRLAGLLKESNSAYPESLRMMTGLEVGWLQRV